MKAILNFGDALKRFRKEFRVSSKEAAESMGTSITMYSKYENGHAFPSVKLLTNLADKYDISADYLLGRIETAYTEKNSISETSPSKKHNSESLTEDDLNGLTLAAEDNRILTYHQELTHVLAKQGITI